ncbi:MAG: TIGR03936 family radical SAM-associated protein [Planctomycetota bacterium]
MVPGTLNPGQSSPGDGGKGSEGANKRTTRYRLRISYRKRGDLRLLSHLDLVRTFERALRRSQLPIAFSEGFNPRVRMSFPGALSTGLESETEQFDIWLMESIEPSIVGNRLREMLPAGLDLLDTQNVTNGFPQTVPGQASLCRYELRSAIEIPLAPSLRDVLEREEMQEFRGNYHLLRYSTERVLLVWNTAHGGSTSRLRDLVAILEMAEPGVAPLRICKLPSEPSDLLLEWTTDDSTRQLPEQSRHPGQSRRPGKRAPERIRSGHTPDQPSPNTTELQPPIRETPSATPPGILGGKPKPAEHKSERRERGPESERSA